MKTLLRSTMYLFALPVLLTLSLSSVLQAQDGALAGTVRDSASQAPLSDVFIEVVSSSGATVASGASGPGGAFRIVQIPAGTYSVRFTSPGWRSTTVDGQVVTAGQTTSFQAVMVEQSYNLNPITVTTSRTEEKLLDAPAAVELAQLAEIQARPATTPVDYVKDLAGVDLIQTGLQSSYVVVRGFNNIFSGATLTLTDNRIARVPSLRANISHLNPITTIDIERMEVVLGPGSALYGPNAANGVIHTITKSAIDHPGVSLSLAGGMRRGAENVLPNDSLRTEPLMHAEGRVAIVPSEKFGFKVSGQYFTGTEFAYVDPVEAQQQQAAVACQAAAYSPLDTGCQAFTEGLIFPSDAPLLQKSVDNVAKGRQNDLKRWTMDARVDWRPNPETSLVVAGGRTNANSSVDLTGIGAGQVQDWAYNFAQTRFQWKELFAQFFMNWSDNEDTYLLRSGRPLIDRSQLFVGQLQHSSQIGSKHRLIYGADMLRTIPKTDSTINGQNEDNDDIWEVGGYVQWEWAINPKLDFVGATRLDKHSLLEDPVFSPRAALVYKPDQANSVRLTYNRAYSTPTTLNFFLDISSGTVPIFGPFRYDVRAQGATKNGLQFERDDGIARHMSPFADFFGIEGVTSRTLLPTNTPTVWNEAMVALGTLELAGLIPSDIANLIRAVPTPTDADIDIVPLTFNPSMVDAAPTEACPTPPFCPTVGGLGGVTDISPLKPTINNTVELGYKGLVGDRLLVGINGWYSHITDYISALRVTTPNLFLNGPQMGQYLGLELIQLGIPPAQAAAIAQTVAGALAPIPYGVVTPKDVGGSISTMALAYENLGSFDLFGGEIAATYLLADSWEVEATFAMVSKDQFTAARGDATEEVPLNAPKYKTTANVRYDNPDNGFNGQVRFRAQAGFPGNSGVYIGDVENYVVFDIGFGWRIAGFRDMWLQLDVSNIFDTNYTSFVGSPELGRLALLRVRYDWSPF